MPAFIYEQKAVIVDVNIKPFTLMIALAIKPAKSVVMGELIH